MLNIKDYIDIVLQLTDRVEKIWSFFFIVNSAIAGWFFVNEKILPLEYLIFATSLYFLYTLFDLMKLLRSYKFLNLALNELRLSIDDLDIKYDQLKADLKELNFENRYIVVILTYIIVFLFVNYTIWTSCLSL